LGPEKEDAPEEAVSETPPENNEPIIIISDTDNGRIVIIQGINGQGYTSLGLPGFGYGRFMRPAQVWLDWDKRLYVADSGNNRVIRVDQQSAQGWSELEDLSTPMGVAVGKAGVYIAEMPENRIIRVKEIVADSPVLETITHPQLTRPSSLWIDADDALYICAGEDPPGGKIFKTWMEKDRRRWQIFEGDGLTGSRFRPSGIVTVKEDIKFIDGSGYRVVNMKNMQGKRLKEQAFRNHKLWRLNRPQGVAVDETGEKFYIADSGNDRILEVRADGSIVGEFFGVKGDPTSVLRNPTSVFVFNPAPKPEPEEDDDEKEK